MITNSDINHVLNVMIRTNEAMNLISEHTSAIIAEILFNDGDLEKIKAEALAISELIQSRFL